MLGCSTFTLTVTLFGSGSFISSAEIRKFAWSSLSNSFIFSSVKKTWPVCWRSPTARKQRMVAWSTNTFDVGSRNIATENRERQFQPSRPLFTNKINCFSDLGVSRRLNSRMSSSVVSFLSPTLTKIRSRGIPRSARISSTAGRTTSFISSIVVPKIAILGNISSGRPASFALSKNLSIAISKNCFWRVWVKLCNLTCFR